MVGEGAVPDEAIEHPSGECETCGKPGDSECETCGKKSLLARIISRSSRSHVHVCDECLDDYRRGDTEVAKMVMLRLRPL